MANRGAVCGHNQINCIAGGAECVGCSSRPFKATWPCHSSSTSSILSDEPVDGLAVFWVADSRRHRDIGREGGSEDIGVFTVQRHGCCTERHCHRRRLSIARERGAVDGRRGQSRRRGQNVVARARVRHRHHVLAGIQRQGSGGRQGRQRRRARDRRIARDRDA